LLSGKDRIYLIGGLKANNEASNDIFEFNPATEEWRKLKPEGVSLPPIESFGAVLINGAEEKIVIAFGFNESTASYSNAVYEYSIAKNKLSVLV
jgi:N-acetylneuraminic acid mutarotase